MSIAVIITDRNTDLLCQTLQDKLPNTHIQQWPAITHPKTVKLAVLWQHPSGITQDMPNLTAVVSMGAGMDHIDADANMPDSVHRLRIVTLALKQSMTQYVLQHILSDLRHAEKYRTQQLTQQWQVLENNEPMPTVGFMGLGQLGEFVADRCVDLGFNTMAWTLSQKHQSHPCFHGKTGLQQVFSKCRYIVILLPHNSETHRIINTETLSWCHEDTVLINVGRGGHVNTDDLLNALDQGQLKHAVLDVFNQEPLSPESPLWLHPKVTVTPHSSARSDIKQTADKVVEYFRQLNL